MGRGRHNNSGNYEFGCDKNVDLNVYPTLLVSG